MKIMIILLVSVFFNQLSFGQTSTDKIIKLIFKKESLIVKRNCDTTKNPIKRIVFTVKCNRSLATKGFILKIKAIETGSEEAHDVNVLTNLLQFDKSKIDENSSDEYSATYNDSITIEILCDKSKIQIDKSITFDITCADAKVQIPTKFLLIILKAEQEKKAEKKKSIDVVFNNNKDTIMVTRQFGTGNSHKFILHIPYTITCDKILAQKGFSLKVNTNSVVAKEIKDFNLLTKQISLQKDSTGIGNTTEIKDSIFLEVIGDTIEKQFDKFVVLTFDTSGFTIKKNKSITVMILKSENPNKYNPDIPFRLSIGANFDFSTKKQIINDVYTELSIFKPDIIEIKKCKKGSIKIGFYGGIYQNNFVSFDSSEMHTTFLVDTKKVSDTTVRIITESDKRKSNTALSSLGLIISPFIKLHSVQNNNFVFDLYGCIHLEAIQRTYTTSFSYIKLSSDTTILPKSTRVIINPISNKLDKTAFTIYDKLIGIGFPFRLSTKTFEVNVKPILFGVSLGNIMSPFSDKYFYLWQFSIIENKFGINLGGEFRGFYGSHSNSTMISIHLSKVFDLTKLASYAQ